jgi:hypothetical protein
MLSCELLAGRAKVMPRVVAHDCRRYARSRNGWATERDDLATKAAGNDPELARPMTHAARDWAYV